MASFIYTPNGANANSIGNKIEVLGSVLLVNGNAVSNTNPLPTTPGGTPTNTQIISVPTDFVDRSGTTNANPLSFNIIAAANPNRQFLRITNKATTGNLYAWDKTAGTPNVNNTISIIPGQSYIWDIKTPKGAIQLTGSIASMLFESAEG